MTAALHGVLAATELEDTNLVAAAVRKHGGLDGGAFNHGLARLDGAVFSGNEKNVVQGHFGAGFGFDGFNLDGVARFAPEPNRLTKPFYIKGKSV